jgi:mannose-1-phosphate guanylyltransferase
MAANPYIVILAGGQGTRLASLTRALYGTDLPKQFAVLAGERSLLQATIERASTLTPRDRISVIVTGSHEELARRQLAPYPGVELIVQPRSLDTAPGMLLPLARILERAWNEPVVFLPSDHFIADDRPITLALRAACDRTLQGRLALLGVTPTGPEVEYGWIVRGAPVGDSGAFAVERFHEKPMTAMAEDLWQRGALWNTFIQAGTASVFWELAQRFLPAHTAILERYAGAIGTRHELRALDEAYRRMTPASFSHDVLAHSRSLAVVPVSGSGWSDWGSPQRVFASLAGTSHHDKLVERVALAS